MVKLHQLELNIKNSDSHWYYLETESSVIFLRFNSAINLYIYLSNKERLAAALKSAAKNKVIELTDSALEKMIDGFSSDPETPAFFGLLASNLFEAVILKRIYKTIYDLSLKAMTENRSHT